MKTKIISFDLETAKKIQAGEINGKIKTRGGDNARIICWDRKSFLNTPIIALIDKGEGKIEELYFYSEKGGHLTDPCTIIDLLLEVPEEAPEEQHPIEESELYQAGYKVGFEAGRCVAFDEKKGCAIKKEVPKYDDVEEVPTGDGSIVFLRHKKYELKPFDKVLVRYQEYHKWEPGIFKSYDTLCGIVRFKTFGNEPAWNYCIPYEGNEHLVGTTDKPNED